MKKQILSFVLLFLPIIVSADNSGSCGENVIWSFEEATGTLTISGAGSMEDNMGCREGSLWSNENNPFKEFGTKVESVIINEGVLTIGGGAFVPCINLKSVSIPNSVYSIGDVAFDGCSNLSEINFTDKISYIGAQAFTNCSSLKSISFPKSLNSIGEYAFSGCTALTSLNIPNGFKIGSYGFSGCTGLTSLKINEDVEIGSGAFQGCNNLISLVIPAGVTIGSAAFWNCTGLLSASFDDSLTSIGNYTFRGCTSLVNVKIPNSVKAIENGLFYECSSLFAVNLPPGLTSIGESSFYGCSSLSDINIPSVVTTIGRWAFARCYALRNINIPNGVTSFEENLFYECGSLIGIEIPEGVTSIGNNVFQNCRNLTTVNIPGVVKQIGENAFRNCERLNSPIIIPEGVTVIENSTFQNCRKLEEVVLSNNIIIIGESAFDNCCNLKSIVLPEELTIIKKRAFSYCLDLKEMVIPAKVEYIYPEAFASPNKLEKIEAKPITPPFLSDDSFSYYGVPLKVPKGCKEAYQTAQGWKNFTNVSDINKYKLAYMVDNEEYKSYEIEEGTSITPEPAPTKEGYTFSGWSEIPETMPAHDVTITGTFTINKYKLVYTVDGADYKTCELEYGAKISPEPTPTKTGSFSINKYKLTYTIDGEEYKSYEVEYAATITPEAAPTKEGYTFSGWSEIPETMPAKDVTVTGTFTINKYKLTYMVDGEEYKSYDIEYGASITPEVSPTKEGYTFSGWSEIPETMPAHDVTVIGTFAVNKYKLIYKVDGAEYKSYEIEYGAAITPEAAPTKEGSTFSGWSEIPETMPAHDVTITGTFTVNKYKLTYKVDGEVYKSYDVEYGATITPESAPTKEGYTFSGWSEIPKSMPAHDVTVTGTFSINKYKLTYIVNNAEYKSYEVEYGATITPEPAPTKEGYTFSGWSEIPATMPAHDVTVTGSYSINSYTLTYMVDGTEYKTISIEYGSSITAETAPTKEGYTFSGWSEIPATMPAHDVTVTGTFSINSYKVTFMYGDNVLTTIEVKYGEKIEQPTSLNSERYTLIEWLNVPETMPAQDITIYADYVDGINDIAADSRDAQYIQLNGMYTTELKPGLNIIRMKDGTTKKVWVK